MNKKEFSVYWDGEHWVQFIEDSNGPSDEIVDFSTIDNLSNGSRWRISHKASKQRKWRNDSAMTLSIYALLDSVQHYLKSGESVFCQTPDVVINFYKL